MLPVKIRITLIVAIIIYYVLILHFLKKKSLELKYTLLWIFAGILMAIFVIFPSFLYNIVRLIGIESNMNGLYVLCIGSIIIILMSITSIVSKQAYKIRSLIQENAMLEKRIRELENKFEKDE